MINANDLRRGLVVQLDGAPCLVLDISQQSPTARGGNTLIKTKYRNLLSDQVLHKTCLGIGCLHLLRQQP